MYRPGMVKPGNIRDFPALYKDKLSNTETTQLSLAHHPKISSDR